MKKFSSPAKSFWNYRSLSLPKGRNAVTGSTLTCHEWYTEPAEVQAKRVEGSLAAFLIAILLTACGESTTTEKIVEVATGNTEIVSSVKDLPKCTKDNAGELVWVKDESATRICVDGKWFATKESSKDTVYVNDGEFSCTTRELKDKSGLKIICNGDSIGVVLNGVNGKDGSEGKPGTQGEKGDSGENGKDGVGCSIAAQTDSLVTIKCGDKSMTLNLRADGVTVDTTSADTVELDSEKIAISLDSLSGYSQKGPFLKGSTVLLYELSDGRTLKQMGSSFTSKIASDDGRYKFSSRNLVSQYALIEVDGKYRNEVTGEPTKTAIKLQAYTNMLMRKSANVNLLTHLEKERVFYLVTKEKKTVRAAKKQAQAEIFKAFHIDASQFNAESEDLDVFGKTDADAALLTISVLLQNQNHDAISAELLTEFSDNMESDGVWEGRYADSVRAWMAEWALYIEPDSIRKHVKGWNIGSGNVPDFEKFVYPFIGDVLGLGVCGSDSVPVGTVKHITNKYSMFYVNSYYDTTSKNAWRMARFICVDDGYAKWNFATNLEADRYGWDPVNAKDGTLLDAPLTGKKIVWDADTLRYADSSEVALNRGCVNYIDGKSLMIDGQYSYYKCSAKGWEYDFKKLNKGSLEYKGQTYKTIGIKTQYWMAENLNYEVKDSYCYEKSADNCEKYGRLYTWAAAVGKSEEECGHGKDCNLTEPIRGICPEGWHLPSSDEWKTLYSAMENNPNAMLAKGVVNWPNATDAYGFSALPAGAFDSGTFDFAGSFADFWSSTEYGSEDADYVNAGAYTGESHVGFNSYGKENAFSVRCVKD